MLWLCCKRIFTVPNGVFISTYPISSACIVRLIHKYFSTGNIPKKVSVGTYIASSWHLHRKRGETISKRDGCCTKCRNGEHAWVQSKRIIAMPLCSISERTCHDNFCIEKNLKVFSFVILFRSIVGMSHNFTRWKILRLCRGYSKFSMSCWVSSYQQSKYYVP